MKGMARMVPATRRETMRMTCMLYRLFSMKYEKTIVGKGIADLKMVFTVSEIDANEALLVAMERA